LTVRVPAGLAVVSQGAEGVRAHPSSPQLVWTTDHRGDSQRAHSAALVGQVRSVMTLAVRGGHRCARRLGASPTPSRGEMSWLAHRLGGGQLVPTGPTDRRSRHCPSVGLARLMAEAESVHIVKHLSAPISSLKLAGSCWKSWFCACGADEFSTGGEGHVDGMGLGWRDCRAGARVLRPAQLSRSDVHRRRALG
jgi:hypothetical protein